METENRRLSEQARAQLAELENLKAHARQVEDDLLAAEDDLAYYDAQSGIDRSKLANLRREREQLRGSVLGGGGYPIGGSRQLAELAQRYPSVLYDPETGIGKLDTDILFDSGKAALKPGAKRVLREFAAALQAPQAAGLKVIVAGHTDDQRIKGREARNLYPTNWHLSAARALAVSDELREAGVNADRLGVAGFGMHQPIVANSSEPARQQNRRVEIFVTSPEVPVVGMTETLTNLY